ncbi:hypothetical protein I203_106251 [Kwoniella mangroviensis CBS 8507]|uniref:uncharacterized protein n=1 Tax=Kwoniella mangroviensis CBS 8507 TaxID=1296122 RepID=UPI00080CE5B0|nr:uncharacterized protein I203_04724 [Kwoniella mangroviensis CBS 8507]OCF66391.1 hypothetical protein I203_04724 [Kwoniella mangroviensis CBS 8507]
MPPKFTSPNSNSNFTTILISLSTLSIYLITYPLHATPYRIAPPIFLIVSLGLIVAAYNLTLLTALISIGSVVFVNLLLAIDYIHGECGYDVMIGGESGHKARLGQIGWYRGCVQPTQAWWIMVIIGSIWLVIAATELLKTRHTSMNGQYLRLSTDAEEESQST